MSYKKKHIKSKIYKISSRKPIFKKMWFWFSILVLVIILTGLYLAIFCPVFQLQNVEIFGNNKVGTQDLKKIVFNYSRSIFLIRTGEIENEILKTFFEIQNLVIIKKFPNTLILNIVERKPIGAFCPSQRKDDCFLIDKNGIIFEPLPDVPDYITIVRKIEKSEQLYLGAEVVGKNIIETIDKIKKFVIDNLKIDLKEAFIASSLRLNVTTNDNWQIYFDLGGGSDIDLQLVKLDLLFKSESYPKKDLQYIDLRPKDRAIVCDNSTCAK